MCCAQAQIWGQQGMGAVQGSVTHRKNGAGHLGCHHPQGNKETTRTRGAWGGDRLGQSTLQSIMEWRNVLSFSLGREDLVMYPPKARLRELF